MSNENQVIELLGYIGNLISNLPKEICDEMENRESIKKAIRMSEIQEDLKFFKDHNTEINKMMFGFNDNKKENDA
tara:strand:+ start:455 stop:679 length:225 start_codon:yes stop_codon:yes gene_type:complete